MKTKLFAGLMAATLAFTVVPMGTAPAQAAEVDAYKLDGYAINQNDNDEISVGDNVYAAGWLTDANGKDVDKDKWTFVDQEWFDNGNIDTLFYSDYNDIKEAEKDMVAFSGKVPEEAFGKNVYNYCGAYLLTDNQNAVWAYVPSKYHVTHWDDSKSYTVDRNDDGKSVTVFTIKNTKKSGKTITFPSSIKIGGKDYKIVKIGDYALDNGKGTGLSAVTFPSTINTIGKEAFKGAENLKTITVKGNLKNIGKNAFSGINKKAVFKIKATESNYKKIVNKIKKAGAPKTATYKRIK